MYFRYAWILTVLLASSVLAACGSGGGGGGGGDTYVSPHFRHVATPEAQRGVATELSHPMLDGNPDATLIVTQVRDVDGAGVTNSSEIAVRYHHVRERWSILNTDFSRSVPLGAIFNVSVFQGGSMTYKSVYWSVGAGSPRASLMHPALDGNPGARVLFTKDITEGNAYLVDFPLSAVFDGREWYLWANDGTNIPNGFMVHVAVTGGLPEGLEHRVRSTNRLSGSHTILPDLPLDMDADAVFHVMSVRRWIGGSWTHGMMRPFGITWVSGRDDWQISTQDGSSIPLDTRFIVQRML